MNGTLPPAYGHCRIGTEGTTRLVQMSTLRSSSIFVFLAFCLAGLVQSSPIDEGKDTFPVTINVNYSIESGDRLPNVSVTWNASSAPSNAVLRTFHVVVCNPRRVCHIYNTTENTVTPTGLQYWTAYTVDVYGIYNVSGTLSIGGVGKLTLCTGKGAPFPPSSLRAYSVSHSTILVTWTNPKSTSSRNITSYKICLARAETNRMCVYSQEEPFQEGPYEVEIQDLQLAATYDVSVWSVITDESLGNFTSKPRKTRVIMPGGVANVTFSVSNVTFASIEWHAPSSSLYHLGGYLISCSSDTINKTVSAAVDPDKTSVVLDLVEQLTTFNCCVAAFVHKGANARAYGQETCISEQTVGQRAPTNLHAVAGSSTSVVLTWDTSKYCINYTIEVSDVQDQEQAPLEIQGVCDDGITKYTHTVNGLQPWTLYNFMVRTCVEYCSRGARVVGRTAATAPSAVRDLRVTLSQAEDVAVQWEPPRVRNGPINGYVISVRNVDSSEKIDKLVKGNEARVEISVSGEGRIYGVTVQAYNSVNGSRLLGPKATSFIYNAKRQRTPNFFWKNPDPKDSVITECAISVLRNHSNVAFNITTTSEAGAVTRLIPWTNYEEQNAVYAVAPVTNENLAIAIESREQTHHPTAFSFSTPTVIFICVIAIVVGVVIIGFLLYRKFQPKSQSERPVLEDAEEMDHREEPRDSTAPAAWNTNFLFHDT